MGETEPCASSCRLLSCQEQIIIFESLLFHTSRTVLKFGKLKALSVSAKLELRKKKKMEMPLAGLAFRSWPRKNKMCFEFHDLRCARGFDLTPLHIPLLQKS